MEQTNVQITQDQPTLTVEIVQNLIPVMTAHVTVGGGSGPAPVFGDTLTGTGTPSDPVNVSDDILDQINNNTQTAQDNASQIEEIQALIPATANQNNPLADQGFVNSSIQTATAYFRGDWATWADVPSDPELYPVDATGNHTPTTNDYMVVIADEQTNGGTWRYKYTGLWSEQGKSGWQAEYQVNETPLTAAQLAALNSGVTAQAVSDIATNKAAVANLQTSKQNKLTAGTGITIEGDTISATGGGGGGASLPDQTGNAGKFLQTNGSEVSWGEALTNKSTHVNATAIGYNKQISTWTGDIYIGTPNTVSTGRSVGSVIVIGENADTLSSTCYKSIAIGASAMVGGRRAIQLGQGTNNDANTFKVSNGNGNFEMMDANGNVPLDRLTYVTNQIGDISTALSAILGE